MSFDIDARAYFNIGTESEICMCSCHRVKHGASACLTPGCSCDGFVSRRAARLLREAVTVPR